MEYGERVQLSEEDFLELMKQQNGWCFHFDGPGVILQIILIIV